MKTYTVTTIIAISSFLLLSACTMHDQLDIQPADTYAEGYYHLETGSFPMPAMAADNLLTEAGVSLGRRLFYEPLLSGDNTQSCAGCHRQEFAFADTLRYSKGILGKDGKRNSMGLFNLAWQPNSFFWDGRAHLLRDQVLVPIQDPLEMNASIDEVVRKLASTSHYPTHFAAAFGDTSIDASRISLALEQFMHSIVSNRSTYDAYLEGQTQLTAAEERGRELFFTDRNPFYPNLSGPNCSHCHSGIHFTNQRFINNGLDEENNLRDPGRHLVTHAPDDLGRFRVPSLRNVEVTAPYMHDGRFATLEEVIDHYDHGLHFSTTLDPALEKQQQTGLRLSAQDKSDLIAFLRTLTDHQLLTNPQYASPF